MSTTPDPECHYCVQWKRINDEAAQDPDGPEYPRPESGNLAPNVLGMKALVYGGCALIVLVCLGLAIWALWP